MTRQSKCVVVAVIMTLLLTAFMFTCFATTEPPVATEPPVVTEPPTDPPVDQTTEPTVDPSTDTSTEPTADPSTEPTVDPSETPTEAPTDNNHYDDFNNYGDGDNDGIPDNTDNNVDDVTNNTPQFPTSEVDRGESKWQEITLDKNSNSSAKSFKTIKENKSTNDNGQWILIVGLVLIALAIIGIIYFIIAVVTYSRKRKQFMVSHKESKNHNNSDFEDDDDMTVIGSTHIKEKTVKPVTPDRERTAIADKKVSEEFLSAADYNKKIRQSGSHSGPRHYK